MGTFGSTAPHVTVPTWSGMVRGLTSSLTASPTLPHGLPNRKQRCEAPRFSCSFFLLFFLFSPGFFCFWILTDYGKC